MMRNATRWTVAAALLAAAAVAQADRAFIRLSAFPQRAVADGRSTSTINIEVRDAQGRSVPDGTRIVLTASIGSFRETIVTTSSGIARATLIAASIPGTARITASVLGFDAPPTTLDFEFVRTRAELSTAQEFVDVLSPSTITYTADTRIVASGAPEQGVYLRYRDVEIRADDLQYETDRGVIRARRATVKIGRNTFRASDFYLEIPSKRGWAVSEYETLSPDTLVGERYAFVFRKRMPDGSLVEPPKVLRTGLLELAGGELRPGKVFPDPGIFDFADLSEAVSTIQARRITVFPNREIQFQKASILVTNARVLSLPSFVVNLRDLRSPLVTDQLVAIRDNQILVNFPYYLSLRPGQSSVARLRIGEEAGRSNGQIGGLFLDYENTWNRGDEMQGGFFLRGINRSDYVATLRQYVQFDPTLTANAQIDMPGGRSVFANASTSKQFLGFQASLSGSFSRALRGPDFSRSDVTLSLEADPWRVGRSPVRLFYGVSGNTNRLSSETFSSSSQTVGLRVRGVTDSIPLDRNNQLLAGFTLGKSYGTSAYRGIGVSATTAIQSQLSRNLSLTTTYDFVQDGFNELSIGKHRLSLVSNLSGGPVSVSVQGGKSLDTDRSNLFGDVSYRLSSLWRLGAGYTYDQFGREKFEDYNLALGYRIGWRELGITYSQRTRRLGIQLLGASF